MDREGFSRRITEIISNNELIHVINREATAIPNTPCIIATGPLTDGALMSSIEDLLGDCLHFHDASAPIVTQESLDMDIVFEESRYDRGSDYLNCPMSRDEYFAFVEELCKAETVSLHDFETPKVFEGCMPVETMAKRGNMTLAFGPLKPVGLSDPRYDKKPFAVVQLRRDNAEGTLYNIVGFQTNLKFPEQKRVFGMIPGLKNAEFVRYGVMHRNSFISSPGILDSTYQCIKHPGLFFAGQITGVEGYVESVSSGFVAGYTLANILNQRSFERFHSSTAIGALAEYVSGYCGKDFQPMNINFGIMKSLDERIRNKQERYLAISICSLAIIDEIVANDLE